MTVSRQGARRSNIRGFGLLVTGNEGMRRAIIGMMLTLLVATVSAENDTLEFSVRDWERRLERLSFALGVALELDHGGEHLGREAWVYESPLVTLECFGATGLKADPVSECSIMGTLPTKDTIVNGPSRGSEAVADGSIVLFFPANLVRMATHDDRRKEDRALEWLLSQFEASAIGRVQENLTFADGTDFYYSYLPSDRGISMTVRLLEGDDLKAKLVEQALDFSVTDFEAAFDVSFYDDMYMDPEEETWEFHEWFLDIREGPYTTMNCMSEFKHKADPVRACSIYVELAADKIGEARKQLLPMFVLLVDLAMRGEESKRTRAMEWLESEFEKRFKEPKTRTVVDSLAFPDGTYFSYDHRSQGVELNVERLKGGELKVKLEEADQ